MFAWNKKRMENLFIQNLLVMDIREFLLRFKTNSYIGVISKNVTLLHRCVKKSYKNVCGYLA